MSTRPLERDESEEAHPEETEEYPVGARALLDGGEDVLGCPVEERVGQGEAHHVDHDNDLMRTASARTI